MESATREEIIERSVEMTMGLAIMEQVKERGEAEKESARFLRLSLAFLGPLFSDKL